MKREEESEKERINTSRRLGSLEDHSKVSAGKSFSCPKISRCF